MGRPINKRWFGTTGTGTGTGKFTGRSPENKYFVTGNFLAKNNTGYKNLMKLTLYTKLGSIKN